MNLPLVVIDAKAQMYTRYLNRVKHVKVHADEPLTAAEIEGFRLTPTLYVAGAMPPEPGVA